MRLVVFSSFLLFCLLSFAQPEALKSISTESKGILIETSKGIYRVNFFQENMLETEFRFKHENFQTLSHAIIAPLKSLEIKRHNSENHSFLLSISELNTKSLSIGVDSIPFQLSYYFNGKLLVSQKENLSDNNTFKVNLGISANEVLYGGGARALGMNRRGNKLELYNKAHYGYETHAPLMNYCIPMFYSSNKYGIHFDSPGAGFLDLDSKHQNEISFEATGKRKVYQVFANENWDNLIENWAELSGKQPKLPRWALGNFASRFGYHSQQEAEQLVKLFEKDNIPLDAVILDLYWFGKTIQGTLGNLEFYRDSFPEPKKMIEQFKRKNIQTIVVTEPFVLTTSKRWNDAVQNNVIAKDSSDKELTYDFYFGNTGLIDVFDKKGSDWFWNRYLELKNMGISGFWGDLGEPEVHPDHMIHATGKAREVHNIYGHRWAEMLYSGLKSNFPNERPFILMRSGSSGSQRFGLIPWSGDVNRTWGGMRSQPEISLQMGMQGIPFMHSDLGGFAGANDDPELYVRWLQYGVFQPIFRPHAQEEVPSEPVFKDDKTKDLAKKAIQLRYRLLPYNYTLMNRAYESGIPLMRPVFFEDSRESFLNNDSCYFWGKDFFIAPVFIKGQKEKIIELPNSSNWVDFNTGKYYSAGEKIRLALSEHSIPTFVKGGAFIPMTDNLKNTAEYDLSKLKIHYFYDPNCSNSQGEFYHDNYLNGQENPSVGKVHMLSKRQGNSTIIIMTNENVNTKTMSFVLHNTTIPFQTIRINGKKLTNTNQTEFTNIPFKKKNIVIEFIENTK